MLLGVVFHSGINYAGGPPKDNWPFRDAAVSQGIAVLLDFIHVFRMPVFFIVAGFFAALLIHRRSLQTFLTNRTQRILLPFLLFLFPTFWLCGNAVLAGGAAMAGNSFQWHSLAMLPEWSLFHLWFLYFLLIYYGLYSVVCWWVKQRGSALPFAFEGARANRLLTRYAPWTWGILAGVGLYLHGTPRVPAPASLMPEPVTLFYYSVFFLAGVGRQGHH